MIKIEISGQWYLFLIAILPIIIPWVLGVWLLVFGLITKPATLVPEKKRKCICEFRKDGGSISASCPVHGKNNSS